MTTRRETRPQTAGASQVRSDFSTGQFERGASPFVTLWAAGPIYILGSHFRMGPTLEALLSFFFTIMHSAFQLRMSSLVIIVLADGWSCHYSRWMERLQFDQLRDFQCLCIL